MRAGCRASLCSAVLLEHLLLIMGKVFRFIRHCGDCGSGLDGYWGVGDGGWQW